MKKADVMSAFLPVIVAQHIVHYLKQFGWLNAAAIESTSFADVQVD